MFDGQVVGLGARAAADRGGSLSFMFVHRLAEMFRRIRSCMPVVRRSAETRGLSQRRRPERVYTDKLSGASTREQRPGLAALLDYAREGDAIVVVGIDRLGRNAAEVMTTIRELGERGIVLRSLPEGVTNAQVAWSLAYSPALQNLNWS